jgi:hypothetical protein
MSPARMAVIPSADDAAAVEQQDPVGNVSQNACCVRALLDLGVEARTIDRERNPPGDVFNKREVVGSIGPAARDPGDGDRADRALTRAEWNADQGARVDAAEELSGLLAVRPFAERWDDLRAAAGDDGAYGLVRLPLRRSPFAGRLGPRDGQAFQRRAFLGQVDQAPIAEVPDDQLGDPLHRRLVVGRRSGVRDFAEQVEPALTLDRLGRCGALGAEQAVALILRVLALADVDEEALSDARLSTRAGNDPRVLAEPDHLAVPRQHAVLALEGNALLDRRRNPVEDAVSIVGMENPLEQLAVPLLGRVADGGFDLRADESGVVAIFRPVDPRDDR